MLYANESWYICKKILEWEVLPQIGLQQLTKQLINAMQETFIVGR
jgi:hypothetical protein